MFSRNDLFCCRVSNIASSAESVPLHKLPQVQVKVARSAGKSSAPVKRMGLVVVRCALPAKMETTRTTSTYNDIMRRNRRDIVLLLYTDFYCPVIASQVRRDLICGSLAYLGNPIVLPLG